MGSVELNSFHVVLHHIQDDAFVGTLFLEIFEEDCSDPFVFGI